MSARGFLAMSSRRAQGVPEGFIARARIRGYVSIYTDPNNAVMVSTDTNVTSFAETCGFIIGHVLGGAAALKEARRPDFGRTSVEEYIVGSIWGGYSSIFKSVNEKGLKILADPSGTVPIYYCQTEPGTILVGTNAKDIESVAGKKFVPDWSCIHRHLLSPQMRSSRTSLADLYELLPGHCLALADGSTRMVWSPWTFAHPDRFITDVGAASELIRDTVRRAIGAWTKPFDNILIGLSGGLDSSIIASCVASSGHDSATCLTISSGVATGNEVGFAKSVTDFCGMALIEDYLDPADIDLDRSAAAHCPRPLGRTFTQSVDAISIRRARLLGVDAFFHGAGGDNVFGYLTSVAPVLDYLMRGDNWVGSWKVLRDLSILTGADMGTAALITARRLMSRRFHFSLSNDASFLLESPGGIDLSDIHPWLRPPRGILPGSAAHVMLISSIYNYLEGTQRELHAPLIAPLMAQPIIEACLSIPSWMWLRDGRNRAMARRAFAADLPRKIIERQSKGTPDGFSIKYFENNRDAILERLMDGPLAQQGVIDKKAIAAAFQSRGPEMGFRRNRLLLLCDTNAWASSWIS